MRHFKIVLAVCLACSMALATGCSDDEKKGRGKAGRRAREEESMGKLRQLAIGIMGYMANNNGKMPPDLKALVPYIEDIEMLRSPLSKGTLPTGESDYVYICVGSMMRLLRPDETMVIYERLENYDGKGTIAAFADGHVERVEDMERFKDLLAKSEALAAERHNRAGGKE